MRQVIYVCGASGSGKTSLALQFSDVAYVIHTDHLALVAAMRLCPFCKPGSAGDWDLWKTLLTHTSAIEALHASFLQSYPDCLSSPRPVIIEGTILVWDQWRDALRTGLMMAGLKIIKETLLWLAPPPGKVYTNIQQRGINNEHAKTLAQVEESCQVYSALAHNPNIERCDSYFHAEGRIQSLVNA